MDGNRRRGPEDRGMVPQGPEDADEDGDRGELRRQVMKSTCSELGGKENCIGGETLVMKSGRMFVCPLKVTRKAVERTIALSLLVNSALLHAQCV